MAVALEKSVKQLEDSGIVSPGKLENFIPPKASPKDAEELAQELISRWASPATLTRSAFRLDEAPTHRHEHNGFRIARALDATPSAG